MALLLIRRKQYYYCDYEQQTNMSLEASLVVVVVGACIRIKAKPKIVEKILRKCALYYKKGLEVE